MARRMNKVEKAQNEVYRIAFIKHANNGPQFDIMDLGKMHAEFDNRVFANGESPDSAMPQIVAKYRKN